ncbi:MAG: hypothetical protein ABR910_17580 [Acidobacteriaceae bacterium]|jgi:hypothetical protein
MCGKWDSPEETIKLLDELKVLGLDDHAFSLVHHWREKGKRATIEGHRVYCTERKSFRKCGSNSLVQERLDAVLTSFKAWRGELHPSFATLAEDAYSKHRHPECSA